MNKHPFMRDIEDLEELIKVSQYEIRIGWLENSLKFYMSLYNISKPNFIHMISYGSGLSIEGAIDDLMHKLDSERSEEVRSEETL